MPRKNILRIPRDILERINTFGQDDVVVAVAKNVLNTDVSAYKAMGLSLDNGEIVVPAPFIPNPSAGRYSKANVHGKEVIRKDLPKYTKSFPIEAPNWHNSGTHTVWHDREVYEREFYPPKEVELAITILEKRPNGSLIKFAVNEVINRKTRNFEDALFYNLNILQENVGAIGVFESAATLAEFAASIRVDWEILPPGASVDLVVANIKAKTTVTAQQEGEIRQRLGVMKRLNPKGYVIGTTGFARYFGAIFGDNFVAFENIRYGNALYIMREGWEKLSQKSRTELMTGDYREVTRIEHRSGWSKTFIALVEEYKWQQAKGLI